MDTALWVPTLAACPALPDSKQATCQQLSATDVTVFEFEVPEPCVALAEASAATLFTPV